MNNCEGNLPCKSTVCCVSLSITFFLNSVVAQSNHQNPNLNKKRSIDILVLPVLDLSL